MDSHSAPLPKPPELPPRAVDRLLSCMPEAIAQSFSEHQREALQAALIASTRRRHPLDWRWSIPLLAKRYYLVVLGGEERRSHPRS